MALSKIKASGITDSSVTSAKITDGTIVNADVSPSAAIAVSKVCGAVSSGETNTMEQNIALLGFKMAVNEGLTVFNLVDGIVDEFHDESGTDEGEGSNDTYCSSSDFYKNTTSSSTPYSAGFAIGSVTEGDTSVTQDNPVHGTVESAEGANVYAKFTVPAGMTSLNLQAWGSGGGTEFESSASEDAGGGGGGYTEGTLAVTAGQILRIAVGEGGAPLEAPGEGGEGGAGLNPQGGGDGGGLPSAPNPGSANGGGGASGIFTACAARDSLHSNAPYIVLVAGAGGGGGNAKSPDTTLPAPQRFAGAGGGLTGDAAGQTSEQTSNGFTSGGGGGDQEQGGQGGASVNPPPDGSPGSFLGGGNATQDSQAGGGGDGYYGGGGAGKHNQPGSRIQAGGGGSSYHGHPQITSGSTEAGALCEGGGVTQPGYVATTNEAVALPSTGFGEDGFVLLTGNGTVDNTASTTIVSNAFTASSAPTTSRIVVFQEDLSGSPSGNLNTDIVASISRDGGSNFTSATLSDSGYVTGASGQRILTGVATVSGQPSGTSMRWKLALANNQSKIHGVSLQWK